VHNVDFDKWTKLVQVDWQLLFAFPIATKRSESVLHATCNQPAEVRALLVGPLVLPRFLSALTLPSHLCAGSHASLECPSVAQA
jgi:hypothetical protein